MTALSLITLNTPNNSKFSTIRKVKVFNLEYPVALLFHTFHTFRQSNIIKCFIVDLLYLYFQNQNTIN